jgi:hypothetical protein
MKSFLNLVKSSWAISHMNMEFVSILETPSSGVAMNVTIAHICTQSMLLTVPACTTQGTVGN